MAKLIGQITYPEQEGLQVEYAKLYDENEGTTLEFRLVNRGKKTVNAYRVDISHTVNGEEKTSSVQGKNLELIGGSSTDIISCTLDKGVEEGTITLSAVIYEDLTHGTEAPAYPFASFATVSRVAESMLSGAVPVAAAKTNSAAQAPAAATQTQEQVTTPKSKAPLLLALSSLGGIILTTVLRILGYDYIATAGTQTYPYMYLAVNLSAIALYTACASLALTAILIRKKKTGQGTAAVILGVLIALWYIYFVLMITGTAVFALIPIILTLVFFILSLVKKNTALLITTLAMFISVFLMIGLFSGCISCGSEKSPDTPQDNNNSGIQTEIGNTVAVHDYLCLNYTSNGDGTCYVSGCSRMSSSAEQPESPHEFAIIGNGADVTIPEYAPNGDRVVAIGERAFYGNEAITSITLASSVKTIYANAFAGNSFLLSVNLGCVETIGNSAFQCCNNLNTVTGLDSLRELQAYAFDLCSSLQTISLSTTLHTVGDYALCGTALTSVTVPYSVNVMGNGVFWDCDSLVSAEIYGSLTYLPADTFHYCSALERVSLTEGMQEIGENAFEDSGLVSITLPETIKKIDTAAFMGCQNLARVFIPYETTSIRNNAFYNCSSLRTVYWGRNSKLEMGTGNGNEDLLNAENHYFGFYNVYFSENSDGTYALNAAYPDSRTEFVIPDTAPNGNSITVISNSCFRDNQNLQSITIPLSITSIEANAFYGCTALQTVIYEGTEESWNQITIVEGNNILYNVEIIFAK